MQVLGRRNVTIKSKPISLAEMMEDKLILPHSLLKSR